MNNRKLKYEFSALESITFGMKMSWLDKLEIIKIIQEKCKKENRQNFIFYEARYCEKSGKIERELII